MFLINTIDSIDYINTIVYLLLQTYKTIFKNNHVPQKVADNEDDHNAHKDSRQIDFPRSIFAATRMRVPG